MSEEPSTTAETAPIAPQVIVPKPDPRKLPPQTKFKTGDAVLSHTGSHDMILGTVLPEHTMNDQVECHWIAAAVAATDKTPAIPETKHATMFFLGQLALIESSPSQPS